MTVLITGAADGNPAGRLLPEDALARPDSLYGVSKAFGEALGRYYADRHGVAVAHGELDPSDPDARLVGGRMAAS